MASLSAPPGADIVNVYLFDQENAKRFKEKTAFTYQLECSREQTKSGIIPVYKPTNNLWYIGVSNPDALHGIHVGLEVVAITQRNTQIIEQIRIPIYTSYVTPTLLSVTE